LENINDFIKKLKVLYVEDEDAARNIFGKFLNKKFETSILCTNGFEGYNEYIKAEQENTPFDLIISDVNMPKIDGIELLEKIRELNKKIPFIFTTARSESEQMIKAINLNVHAYLLKPLDFSLIEKTIEKICEDIYYKKNYEKQKNETDAYLSVLNKEAIVVKTDFDGNITFVNDAFMDVSGYIEDDVIGKNHSMLKHPDVPTSFYNEIWEIARSGKIWEGTLKNLSKSGEAYFVNTKIIPIYNDLGKEIVQFISIRFLVTEEENQRRAQNKRFLEQISTYKKEIAHLKKEKEEIFLKVNNSTENTHVLKEKILNLENKTKSLLGQLATYETQNIEFSKRDLMIKQDKNKQFETMVKQLQQTKTQNKALVKSFEDLKSTALHKDKEISLLENKQVEHEKRISGLVDLVNNLQKEIKILKGENSHE
jgi:PAS domain S-box-containing protein